ncbi:hypothetical protein [Blastopirellula marina]|uniref:Uncharacterized protein n=1 Tax=Blastopirellula marina TaxID=124 RepID=A0A2S8GG69_9BACT|nr:hypothetical protein [Blastopirellula marina]PQO43044.1 hypothetical protein C5Y93_25345 [Blastopirellula marina]
MVPPTTNPETPPAADEQPSRPSPAPGSRKLLAIIIAAFFAWGIFLAVGVYLNVSGEADERFDFRRPLLVLGCTMAFLSFWLLLLWSKSRKAA